MDDDTYIDRFVKDSLISNDNFATTNTPASSGVDAGDSKAHDRREGD
jgi:hypothetical protein